MTERALLKTAPNVAFLPERQQAEELQALNDQLYEAARAVLSNWDKFGQLAQAVRLLGEVVEEIDDHHDEIAAAKAGWEPKDNTWVRFTVAGERLDPEICPSKIWIADGMIHVLRAEDALTQDSFRDLRRACPPPHTHTARRAP